MNDLKERLAREQHAIWSHWMRYLFSQCKSITGFDEDGVVIPGNLVEHWQRQMDTEYKDLLEHEKQSDRDQVDKFWTLIVASLRSVELRAVDDYIKQVNERAEQNMERTNKLEGSHYAAMQTVRDEWQYQR